MDYVTRQIVVLIKKFRKELPKLTDRIHRDLKEHTEAIHQSQKSETQNQNIPPNWLYPIIAKYEKAERDKQTETDRQYSVQNSLRYAAWSAFVAAAIYAAITACQLRTANHALVELKAANNISTEASRPWIGFVEYDRPDFSFSPHPRPKDSPLYELRYFWRLKNVGKRPARLERMAETANWSKDCVEPPDYDHVPTGIDPKSLSSTFEGQRKGSRPVIVPDATYVVSFAMMLPPKRDKGNTCLYISVEYRDTSYPDVIHHTRACRIAIPQMKAFGECSNDYAYAD